MTKREKKIKKIAKQNVRKQEKEMEKDDEDVISEFAVTPFGVRYKFKGDEKTFMMFSHHRRGYFL